MASENVPDIGARERTWRRFLQYGFRIAVACALTGFLLGLTIRESESAPGHYPARAYVAAILGIIGVIGGGATVVVSFILNVLYAGRRARQRM